MSKIELMEHGYHHGLKELQLYSPEKEIERYLIIYVWQQIDELKHSIHGLKKKSRKKKKQDN